MALRGLRFLAAIASCSPAAVSAQSASPQTAPSPWSLHEAIGEPDDLKISGTFRVRHDSIDGQPRPGFNAADDTLNIRTSIFAEYRAGPLRFGGEIYDSRVYFADAGTPVGSSDVNVFEPVQAYVALDLPDALGKGRGLTAQAGRFVLNLGSRRLVAADDFRNTTNGYTGLRLDLAPATNLLATLIYVLPQRRLPDDLDAVLDNAFALDGEGFDAVLFGGLVTRRNALGAVAAEASYLRFRETDEPGAATRERALHTIGVRAYREPAAGKVDFELEGLYQFGSISAGTAPGSPRLDVSATFFHADLGYTFDAQWKPRVSLRYDRASGDRPGATFSRFDTLFGMRRAELGPSGLYNTVGRANLSSPALRIEAAPGKRTDAFVHYRPLWLASRTDGFSTSGVRDASGRSGSFAGHQIEFRVRHWLVQDALRLELGALALAKGRFLRDAPNAPATGDTRYTNLNLTAFF